MFREIEISLTMSGDNSKPPDAVDSIKPAQSAKIRVPGADDPKNALEVFKIQFQNFSKFETVIKEK